MDVSMMARMFNVSESCYRYQAKLRAEDDVIADWLIRLTTAHRNWGFGLCFLYLGVESPEGTSPSGAHGTGRERLRSSGSSHRSLPPQQRPVCKQLRVPARNPCQPVARPSTTASQPFECKRPAIYTVQRRHTPKQVPT